MDLEKVTKVKRRAIEEALFVWTSKDRKTDGGRKDFYAEMEKLGWKETGYGSYKCCLCKESIAIKYSKNVNHEESNWEVKREFEQFQRATNKFKRYLPVVYAFVDGLLIQDKVLVKCNYGANCKEAQKIANKFPVLDYGHNHGHSIKGVVKFFDWVYNRQWSLVYAKGDKDFFDGLKKDQIV